MYLSIVYNRDYNLLILYLAIIIFFLLIIALSKYPSPVDISEPAKKTRATRILVTTGLKIDLDDPVLHFSINDIKIR